VCGDSEAEDEVGELSNERLRFKLGIVSDLECRIKVNNL
jgi:hypothetical protein